MARLSARSRGLTPSLAATSALASASLMPRCISRRATRSPAARKPFMPEAQACATSMPNVSPEPTYKPSSRRMSTQAREQRETASMGGKPNIGTPPTPMPTFMCTGMRASAMHGLT
jgi:hypothetical protein